MSSAKKKKKKGKLPDEKTENSSIQRDKMKP